MIGHLWRIAGGALVALVLLSSGVPAGSAPMRPDPKRIAEINDVFSPNLSGPDFELTASKEKTGPFRETSQTIRRHRDWIRIDKRDGDIASTDYVHLGTGTFLGLWRTPDGRRGFEITALAAHGPSSTGSATRTGRIDKVAGEACEVWEIYRGGGANPWRHLSCVTKDGIELASWTLSSKGQPWPGKFKAVKLVRRPVAPKDVEPPVEAFRFDALAAEHRDSGRDYEVILRPEHASAGQRRIIRRHAGWVRDETVERDQRRLWASDGESGLDVTYAANGAPLRLVFSRQGRIEKVSKPALKRGPSTILGLKCEWVDAMPNVADAGLHECRTVDDLLLSYMKFGRGRSGATWTATAISNRSLRMQDVLPPAEIQDLRTWGLATTP